MGYNLCFRNRYYSRVNKKIRVEEKEVTKTSTPFMARDDMRINGYKSKRVPVICVLSSLIYPLVIYRSCACS